MAQEQLTLYTYFRSSCSARVRIGLNLKNIAYTSKYINLLAGEQSANDYSSINPSAFVPALVLPDDTILTQSVAILEYLEEQYPDSRSLLPPKEDVIGRFRVRALVDVVACDIQPVTNDRIAKRIAALGGSGEEYAKELMTEGLLAYEKLVKDTAGEFSYGDQITLADVVLVPAVWNAQRYGVDLEKMPIVRKIHECMEKEDAIIRANYKNQGDTPEYLAK